MTQESDENQQHNNLREYYQKNQEYFDKAILAIILAMPPFLVVLFNFLIKPEASMNLKYTYLTVLGLSFVAIVFYLLAFVLARNGCDNLDYASKLSSEDFAKDFIEEKQQRLQRKANFQIQISNWLENIYLCLIVVILGGIFYGFYDYLV